MTTGNVYEPGHRPRCKVCDRELVPALSYFDGEPGWCGFHPCPDHPGAGVVYVLGTEVGR